MDFSIENNTSQTVTAGAASQENGEGIVPVFIKQLLDHPKPNFSLFGMNFGMVEVVGIVRNIETSSTKITYLLEDHSGNIEVHFWLQDENPSNVPDVMMNSYARVYASVRDQMNVKSLLALKMFAISDPNDVNTHGLEALRSRYAAQKFMGKKAAEAPKPNNTNSNGNSTDNDLGLTGKLATIYQIIKSHIGSDGIERKEIHRRLKQLKTKEIDEYLEELTLEGHIYSTIDADHFVITE